MYIAPWHAPRYGFCESLSHQIQNPAGDWYWKVLPSKAMPLKTTCSELFAAPRPVAATRPSAAAASVAKTRRNAFGRDIRPILPLTPGLIETIRRCARIGLAR